MPNRLKEPTKRIIKERLSAIRKKRGISQACVAKALGMCSGSYSDIERGKVDINVSRLKHLSNILTCGYEEIIG